MTPFHFRADADPAPLRLHQPLPEADTLLVDTEDPAPPRMPSKLLCDALRGLAAEGPLILRIAGVCMEPGISDGALVIVARARYYWPGDVLAFYATDGRLTVHRLIGAARWRGHFHLFTRADNAHEPDAAILASDVLGRVIGGDCARSVASVPLAQRLKSFTFFLRCALMRIFRRSPLAWTMSRRC